MTANERQVGGTHYQSLFQHWDLVTETRMPYLEAQVVKYVTRYRKKNGVQDLQKAEHFLQKLLENAYRCKTLPCNAINKTLLDNFCKANNLTTDEQAVIERVGLWGGVSDLEDALFLLQTLLHNYREGMRLVEPQGRGYVNQD